MVIETKVGNIYMLDEGKDRYFLQVTRITDKYVFARADRFAKSYKYSLKQFGEIEKTWSRYYGL